MCSSAESLRSKAAWSGRAGNSRSELFQKLQSYVAVIALLNPVAFIPSSMILPDHRMQTLLEQAIQFQEQKCLYHNTAAYPISLFNDHLCERCGISLCYFDPYFIHLGTNFPASPPTYSTSILTKFGMLHSRIPGCFLRPPPKTPLASFGI